MLGNFLDLSRLDFMAIITIVIISYAFRLFVIYYFVMLCIELAKIIAWRHNHNWLSHSALYEELEIIFIKFAAWLSGFILIEAAVRTGKLIA